MKEQLLSKNYQILENQIDDKGYFQSISAKKGDLYFVIEREQVSSYLDTYLCDVKMVVHSNIDLNFKINLPVSSARQSTTEIGREDNYIIEANRPEEIRKFIENKQIEYLITQLINTSINSEFRVTSKNKRSLIKIQTDCVFTRALAALPWLESFSKFLIRKNDLETLISGLGKYECSNCGKEIEMLGIKCKSCGATAPVCVICFREPSDKESVGLMNCCGSYLHFKELRTWLDVKNSCPYCKTEDPTIKTIE